jgi:hypothetical protein
MSKKQNSSGIVTPESAIYKLLVDRVDVSHASWNTKGMIPFVFFFAFSNIFLWGLYLQKSDRLMLVSIGLISASAFFGYMFYYSNWVDKPRGILKYRLNTVQQWAEELDRMFNIHGTSGSNVHLFETTSVTGIKSTAFGMLISLARKILVIQKDTRTFLPSIQPPDFRERLERILNRYVNEAVNRLCEVYNRLNELGLAPDGGYGPIFQKAKKFYYPDFD